MAKELDVKSNLVSPYVKNPNRSERAIRTAKNHMIATRVGFHPDCPHTYLDKCLFQIEMTLNIVRPFDYNPNVSAYAGLHGSSFNFRQHPIAPVGTKVLTWDAPDHRGSWADHGVPAVYLGPAPNHFRAFEVYVPNTSAPRITNTVWWFMHDVGPDTALLDIDPAHAYPPTKHRPDPKPNGADLIGRVFVEPEIGVCQIIGLGPATQHRLATRAQVQRQKKDGATAIDQGAHYTLMYTQTSTGEEHFSSLSEILNWIASGPILQPPTLPGPTNKTDAPITTPAHVPATIQYIPNVTPARIYPLQVHPAFPLQNERVSVRNEKPRHNKAQKQRVSDSNVKIARTDKTFPIGQIPTDRSRHPR
jgi:hypothetical protein